MLLASSRPEDQKFAAGVAMGLKGSLKVASSHSDAIQAIRAEKPRLVLVDCPAKQSYDAFEKMVQESIGLFSEEINPNRILFLLDHDFETANFLIQSPLFGGFILRKSVDPQADGKFFGRVLRLCDESSGIEFPLFFEGGSKVQTLQFQNSNQKQESVEAVRRFLIQAKFQSRMASVVANAVDEVLMNAMYDAPIDDLGKQLYVATSRATSLDLRGRAAVEMMVGFDGEYVGIRVRDQYGSVDKNRLLTKLGTVYTESEYQVRSTVAGAGLGLSTVMRSGASLVFNCESRQRTDVAFFFRRTDSYKDFREQFRFVATQFFF